MSRLNLYPEKVFPKVFLLSTTFCSYRDLGPEARWRTKQKEVGFTVCAGRSSSPQRRRSKMILGGRCPHLPRRATDMVKTLRGFDLRKTGWDSDLRKICARGLNRMGAFTGMYGSRLAIGNRIGYLIHENRLTTRADTFAGSPRLPTRWSRLEFTQFRRDGIATVRLPYCQALLYRWRSNPASRAGRLCDQFRRRLPLRRTGTTAFGGLVDQTDAAIDSADRFGCRFDTGTVAPGDNSRNSDRKSRAGV